MGTLSNDEDDNSVNDSEKYEFPFTKSFSGHYTKSGHVKLR